MLMKTILTSVACLSVLFAAVNAGAETEKKQPTQKSETDKTPKAAVAASGKSSKLTGSYIKHKYRRTGQITDGPYNVVVIDREAIEQSGATDVRELLVRKGLRR